jgi:hypothetical protein
MNGTVVVLFSVQFVGHACCQRTREVESLTVRLNEATALHEREKQSLQLQIQRSEADIALVRGSVSRPSQCGCSTHSVLPTTPHQTT